MSASSEAKTGKRNKTEVERDRRLIAQMHLRGKLQAEIAVELRLHPSTVSRDLNAIRVEWKEFYLRDFDEKKARELARIDELEREYWQAWKDSREQRERMRSGRRTKPDGVTDEAFITRENQYGDPRFLQGIQWCIEQRCKIFGFYAPTKLAVQDIDELIKKELDLIAAAQNKPGSPPDEPANSYTN